LQEQVLRKEFIEYVICGLREELRRRQQTINSERKQLLEVKGSTESELNRLVEAIAVGQAAPTVMAAIAEREDKIRAINVALVESRLDCVEEKLEDLRSRACSRLARLRDLLASPSAIHEAKALLAEQVGKFTLVRVKEGEKISYRANGQMDFFREEYITRPSGAGGGNCSQGCEQPILQI
jgi:hypothetical protein